MLGIVLLGIILLVFVVSFLVWQHNVCNTNTCGYLQVCNNDLNNPWMSFKCYFFLLLLELPKRIMQSRILIKVWDQWASSNQTIEIKAKNINLPPAKQVEFMEYINKNEILENNGSFEWVNTNAQQNTQYQKMISYYSILVGKLQLFALSHSKFPLPILGAVHMSNEFELFCSLDENNSFDIDLKIKGFSLHKAGVLFNIESTITQNNKQIWRCISTFLSIMKLPKSLHAELKKTLSNASPTSKKSLTETMIKSFGCEQDFTEIKFPSNMGKKFASICGDYNPIHTNRILAKLFGFRSCIAHGICAFTKCLTQVSGHHVPNHFPLRASVYFISPIFIPNSVILQYAGVSYEKTKERLHVAVLSKGKTCIVGHLE